MGSAGRLSNRTSITRKYFSSKAQSLRCQYKSTEDLIQKLFICVSGKEINIYWGLYYIPWIQKIFISRKSLAILLPLGSGKTPPKITILWASYCPYPIYHSKLLAFVSLHDCLKYQLSFFCCSYFLCNPSFSFTFCTYMVVIIWVNNVSFFNVAMKSMQWLRRKRHRKILPWDFFCCCPILTHLKALSFPSPSILLAPGLFFSPFLQPYG